MSYRTINSIAAAAILGIVCVSTEALYVSRHSPRQHSMSAAVIERRFYRGAYVHRGVGVGIGAAAVGAAVMAPRYYNSAYPDITPVPATKTRAIWYCH